MNDDNSSDKIEFNNISADNHEGVTEIESLCVNCEENGITKLLFVKIPFYREVIISSFSCEHCNYTNNEIQSAGQIQEKGCEIQFKVSTIEDLNQEIVKTDSAVFKIVELGFEIPAFTQKGCLSTLKESYNVQEMVFYKINQLEKSCIQKL